MTIDVSYRWPDQFSHEETLMNSQTRSSLLTDQAPVDRRVDKATNWINLYPLDSTKRFGNTEQRYPPSEQLGRDPLSLSYSK